MRGLLSCVVRAKYQSRPIVLSSVSSNKMIRRDAACTLMNDQTSIPSPARGSGLPMYWSTTDIISMICRCSISPKIPRCSACPLTVFCWSGACSTPLEVEVGAGSGRLVPKKNGVEPAHHKYSCLMSGAWPPSGWGQGKTSFLGLPVQGKVSFPCRRPVSGNESAVAKMNRNQT